ncbi:MAG: hypothetical protein U0Y08_07025 [Bacteroidia bacterium]
MKTLLTAVIFLYFFSSASAQDKKSPAPPPDYKNQPVWISMMDDPNVNYYEAVHAFEAYWEGRIEPEEESELINEGHITTAQADSLRRVRSGWTQTQRNQYEQLKYQFKRFKDWKRTVLPFVQNDGRILSEQERMEIWQKQQSPPVQK